MDMARVVNEEEKAARRNQILDVTQSLIYTKGYEKMTIQDVLDGLQMSKGAFYHYFASKEALLEALTDRMIDEAMQVLHPIEVDDQLPALAKLRHYFDTSTRWKTERRDLLLPLVRVWYHDDNLVARQKFFTKSIQRISGFMTTVICQGVREGTMNTPYPEQVGDVILAMFLSMGEALAQQILAAHPSLADLQRVGQLLAVYSDAIERILGAPPGSLPLGDKEMLQQWIVPPELVPDAALAAA
jgi:AcrR family transcriptional regulator